MEYVQPFQKLDEVGATAHDNVLAVIHRDARLLVGKGEHPPSQKTPGLDQRNGISPIHQVLSSGDSGDTTAQHYYFGLWDLGGNMLVSHVWAIIRSFSALLRPMRWCRTS